MIAGRKFILDLLFIKYSVLRWEINMRQGVGCGGGRERNIELGPCQAGSCFVWAVPEAFWGQRPHVSEMLGGTGQRAWAQETSRPG